MTDPLTFGFDVACPVAHAFEVWTERIGTWWPADHTVGGAGEVDVVLHPGVGGLIVERRPGGVEHVWGRVTAWEPPHRLGYTWHIGQPAEDATDVEIRFTARDAQTTRVDIEQRGWERLGTRAGAWRERNYAGWASLLPHYRTALQEEVI